MTKRMTIEQQEAALKRLIQFEASENKDEEFVISEIKERMEYVPNKKLYKFRKITDQNLATLKENKIWLPCASFFKDALDMVVNVDLEKDSAVIAGCLPSKTISMEKLDQLNESLEEERYLLREHKAVYCMSEELNNPKQWEDYADTYQGFAIEYSFDKISSFAMEKYDFLVSLFPMIYVEQKPRFEIARLIDHIKKNLPAKVDHPEGLELETKLHMQMFYKSQDYEREYEWRFFKTCENGEGVLIEFPFVSAIYAGKDIKEGNLRRLKNIVKRLGVPIYKQRLNKAKNGYEYIVI